MENEYYSFQPRKYLLSMKVGEQRTLLTSVQVRKHQERSIAVEETRLRLMENKQESGGRNTYPHRTREINPSRSVGGVVAKYATSNLLIQCVSGRKAAYGSSSVVEQGSSL